MPLHYVNSRKPARSVSSSNGDDGAVEAGFGWDEFLGWFGGRPGQILARTEVAPVQVEEIRLRVNQPLLLRLTGEDLFLDRTGQPAPAQDAYRVELSDLAETMDRLTQSSLYAAAENLRQGFLTLPGGHRVGITGEAVMKQGSLQTIKHITGLNFRLAQDIRALGLDILPHLISSERRLHHTIILSAPRAGKTTLLRALIRWLSNGVPELGLPGQAVGVVDERGELAGLWQGVPAYDLGRRTDVLGSCPKALGMGMLIRSMGPEVVAVDEVGHAEDVAAIAEALRSGVSILSTAHAGSLEEARCRPILRDLLVGGIFERAVLLSRRRGPGTVESVLDLARGQEVRPWGRVANR
ncbi:hypothetical protein CEB3_c22870 [Peptococcaceae bacterium CEB3]|nr:hypothetical protein CEB3_c22870 [Peptococcaceae bacterium CEB3]